MSVVPFGRVVSLSTEVAQNERFRIGLEAIEPARGRLVSEPVTDYQGQGLMFRPGDVLFAKLRPYLAKAWLADISGAAVGDFHVYRPRREVLLPEFLKWLVLSRAFLDPVTSAVFGTKMPRASWEFVRTVEVHLPSTPEQRAIADYLDRETAQIDTLIEEQQRLMELLGERRHAMRTHLVLHGLEAAFEVETQIPWATRLPAHWPVVPLRSVAQLESGHTPNRAREEWWVNCHIPWVSLHDVGRMRGATKYMHETAQYISDLGLENSSARVLPAGTVVLSRDATVGRTAIMGIPMATSQHFAAWICRPSLDPEYLWSLFTDAMQHSFASFQNGSTIRTIGMGDLHAFRIPLPPLGEQRRIVDYLDEHTAKIDLLISETERFIELSKERRSALITAAVAGQIDVRGKVA